jgi:hypothetical protein
LYPTHKLSVPIPNDARPITHLPPEKSLNSLNKIEVSVLLIAGAKDIEGSIFPGLNIY